MNFRFVVIAIYSVAAISCSKGCAKSQPTADSGPREVLTAVHTSTPPKLDGEGEDEVWLKAKPTRAFALADGGPGRPHAEVRASWDDSALYLLFYSGDEDLEPDDLVYADLTGARGEAVHLAVSVNGEVQGPRAVQAAVDRDGSMSDAGDDDEEWLAEVVVPWEVIGKSDTVSATFRRHDRPKGAAARELVWSGEIRLGH